MSRALRPIYVAMRAPALADRRGFRWMLNERLWPAPVVVLRHRGRRSGKLYSTPVEAINEDREDRRIVISPMRGTESDWYRNILTDGLVEVRLRGESFDAEWRSMSEQENLDALTRYRSEHPLYGRMVLWMLARGHRASGDPLETVAKHIPMLTVQLKPRETDQVPAAGNEPVAAASRSSDAAR
jgi:deazaflavin-dependent oxidoreductase (nitroreductase family)